MVFFVSPWSPTLANMAAYCDAESDGISEEIELLKAIYVHELEIHGPEERPTLVNLFLHPSTGDDDHDSKYVCLNLVLTISEKYPFLSPGISIKNPRGLSDAHVASIQENLLALAKERIGSPMLYDLIEYAKECLSDNNIPSCPCVICLEHFEREEKFVKTECYHYFHAVCLANYVDHFLNVNEDKTIVCPMCRLEIEYNKNEYNTEEDDSFSEGIFVYKPDKEQMRAQAERQRIFEYQKRKGGIIDVEEERNKFLIGIKDRKEDESESNELQPHRVAMAVEMPQKTVDKDGLSREGRQGLNGDQGCADKGERSSGRNKPRSRNNLKKSERNNEKNNTRGSATEGQGEGQACDAVSRKRTGDSRPGERNDNRPARPGERNDSRPGERNDSRPGERGDSRPGERNDSRPGERNDSRPIRSGERNDRRPGERNDNRPARPGERNDSRPGERGNSRPTTPGERNDNRPRRSQEKRREDRDNFRQAEVPRKERDLNSKRKDEKILKQPKENKGRVVDSLIPDDMNSGEEERKSKDCNLSSSDRQMNKMSSEEQAKEENRRDATDGKKTENEEGLATPLKLSTAPSQTTQLKLSSTPSQTTQLKLSATPPQTTQLKLSTTPSQTTQLKLSSAPYQSTQSRNMEPRKERNGSSNTRNMSNNSTSKQVTNKQHERKPRERNEPQRKGKGGRTFRRPQEESKNYKPPDEKKYPKSYSSVTSGTNRTESAKRRDQTIKRNDALVSENNNKSWNKSGQNFPGKAGKNSPNVVDNVVKSDGSVKANKQPMRTPPPGFENFQPAVVDGLEKGQRSGSKETLQTAHGDPSVTRDGPLRRRPPPGFENVKPSVKKL